MSITDELREWFKDRLFMGNGYAELTAIADRIDAEHEAMLVDARKTVYQGYIELPKDADGEYIHVGDEVEEVDYDGHASDIELWLTSDGWWVCVGGICRRPDRIRHHHAPTVEDVLREFAEGLGVPVADSYVAATAAKLRLAEGEDA